ncbi:hypothetical protein D3C81_2012990 [compost metagenome]
MNTFINYDEVPLGASIRRNRGERKGWVLVRVFPEFAHSYHGPTFHCEKTDEVFEDWDLPDDTNWDLLI